MMPGFIRRFLTLNHSYDDVIERQRANRLLYIVSIIFVISLLWTITLSLPSIANGELGIEQIVSPIMLITTVFLYNLIQQGRVQWAARLFVLIIALFTIGPQANNLNSPQLTVVILPVVLAAVLLDINDLLLLTGLIILLVIRSSLTATGLTFAAAVGISVTIFLSALFLALFKNNLVNISQTAGELITKTNQVTQYQLADTDSNIQNIIRSAINLLRTNLGYHYIRVVILDDDQNIAQTYYSSIGLERVAETTNFSFTADSSFHQARTLQKTQIIEANASTQSSHLLPSSNGGVIIPAISFNQVVALFDIQTENKSLIRPELITILEAFVQKIAITMNYQRMRSALQNDINEQQVIINQQRTLINNMQSRQTEGIMTDWQYYLQQRGLNALGYDIDEQQQISNLTLGDIPDNLKKAFEAGEVIVQTEGDKQNVIIPIQFREAVLGAIAFNIPADIPITDRKLDFIRSVTERLALALDNKRLLEQTRIQAQRESTANEIGSLLLRSTDVQTVLQTAADRFNQALGAVSTRIYLQPSSLQTVEKQEDSV